jgi:serine/threonine protein kinase
MSRISSREEALFADALALPPAERGTFLAKACGANVDLLAHLVALVAAHDGPDTLLRGSAPPREILHDEKPGDAIGRYKLLQRIGEGGCGVVWMAEQEEPVRRRVALKVIKLGMDTKTVVARFEAERQALAMMDHPNIAKVHDAGATDTGRPFFVMELVRGVPITKYCDENHLTPKARLELFIKVCQAIQHAHQKGVIHRDIKPSNLLVTVNDGAPTPKVIDFGIAKATQGRLTDATVFTAFEQFIGTPVYMSPEQAEMSSLDIDTRSDIYSLGVLLYELLSGKPPFDPKKFAQAGVDQIRQQIREVEPSRPSARLRTLTEEEQTTIARLRSTAPSELSIMLRGDLDWIVMRCIEKDRTRRYDTANGLAMDIQRYLRNEPVVARPPSTAYLLQKLVARHRVAFMAASLVAAILVLGSTIATIAWLREQKARQQARDAETLAEAGRAQAELLLTFVFTDFAERLDAFGQRRMVRELGRKAVAYYEKLPAALRTPETQVNFAFALAADGDDDAKIERAARIIAQEEARAPLTPFMRVAAGFVANQQAWRLWTLRRPAEAEPVCERGERLLRPVLDDPEWGAWARRWLMAVFHVRGRNLQTMGRNASAVPFFDEAIALARRAEELPPFSARPGLLVARVMVDACEALFLSGRRQEGREMAVEAAARWRRATERDPLLFEDRLNLARVLRRQTTFALEDWNFSDFLSINAELQVIYKDLLKHDPTRLAYRNSLATSFGSASAWYRWRQGEFAAAESDLRTAVELLRVEWASPLERGTLQRMLLELARLYSATDRLPEAERCLTEARLLHKRRQDEQKRNQPEKELSWLGFEADERSAQIVGARWSAVKKGAEQTLERLARLPAESGSSRRREQIERWAHRDLMRVAFEIGDYATARRLLDRWAPPTDPEPATADIQQRFGRIFPMLLRIHVLARGGERELAQHELRRIWPELEAVYAVAPDFLVNQVQHARALSIRAEVDGSLEEKRAWLERALSFLQPAADAGKLTRYERDVLFTGITRQLAALDKSY